MHDPVNAATALAPTFAGSDASVADDSLDGTGRISPVFAVNTKAIRDDRGRFQPGNPGRPRGALNRATLLAQNMLDADTHQIMYALIESGLQGDAASLRMCASRLLPARRDTPVEFDLPVVETAADAAAALGRVALEVAAGTLTPSEGYKIAAILDRQRAAIESVDLEARIARLETLVVKEVVE